MKKSLDDLTTVRDVITYLKELPQDAQVLSWIVEDNTSTVFVSMSGVANVLRNSKGDHRVLLVNLPPRAS